jgi:hypothetical protein
MRLTATGLALLALACAAASAASPARPLQRATFFGDSVAASLSYDATARAIASRDVAIDYELAACRRIEVPSCAIRGSGPPPTMLQAIRALSRRVGPTAIVAVGYNDGPPEFARSLADALRALWAAGTEHVLWLTYREQHHPYVEMNAELRAAARPEPRLTVVDWNAYSRSHPSWFAADGIHLANGGAEAMATLVHATLVRLGLTGPVGPPLAVLTTRLPATVWGARYDVRLEARGGTAPYRWRIDGGGVYGLRLDPAGELTGEARDAPGKHAVRVRVTDAAGGEATKTLVLDESI